MKNTESSFNKKCAGSKCQCPISEMAAESIKKLTESYDNLAAAAAKLEGAESCPEFLKDRAWQRVERVGRVLDNLLAAWEQQNCPPLCFNCEWQECQRALAILDVLTPCDQWFVPGLVKPPSSD